MYHAFEPILLLDKLPIKIESITFHKDILYIGTQSGILLLYKIIPITPTSEDTIAYTDEYGQSYKLELLKSLKSFSKKSIDQLEIISELGLLLALTDNQVNAYELSTLSFQASLAPSYFLNQAKGQLSFVTFTGIEMLEEENGNKGGIPVMTTRLCILGKKSIIMMMWKDSEFDAEKTKEYPLPDKVRSINFLTATQLWLGTINKEYYQMDLNDGSYKEINVNLNIDQNSNNNNNNNDLKQEEEKIGSSVEKKGKLSPTPSIRTGMASMISGIAYTSTQYVSSYNPLNSILSNQHYKLPMLRLNEKQMIIIKDGFGIIVNEKLKVERDIILQLPEEVYYLLYCYPYILIITKNQVEVRNLSSQITVQTMQLNNPIIAIKDGKAPFLATNNQVYRWLPSHFANQINQLVELKLYSEALVLLEQNKSRISEIKVNTEIEIKKMLALDKFFNGQYDLGLNLFFELKTQVNELTELFPKLVNGKWEEFIKDYEKIKENKENKSNRNSPISNNEDESMTSYITNSEEWNFNRLIKAIESFIIILTQYRNYYLKENELKEMKLIDTTLIKCYLVTNEAMVGPLLRIKNYVDVIEIESILKELKKYKELTELYFNKELHRNGLQLLKELSQKEKKEDQIIITSILDYLKRITDFNLIMEYSSYCFEYSPEETLNLYLIEHLNSESYNCKQIIDFLKGINNQYALIYCKNVLDEKYTGFKKATKPNHQNINDIQVHTDYALLLIDCLIKLLDDIHKQCEVNNEDKKNDINLNLEAYIWQNNNDNNNNTISWEDLILINDNNETITIRDNNKLINILNLCQEHINELIYFLLAIPSYYKYEKIMSRLPTNLLYKPRAIILYKLKRYDLGLNIIVEKLKDYNGAIEYCQIENNEEIYYLLLKMYLKFELKEEYIKLINQYFKYLPLLESLKLLPNDVQMKQIELFLLKNIQSNLFQQHIKKLQLNLSKAYQHQLNKQMLKYKQKKIVIDKDTICNYCLKRIGISAFKWFPNGTVLHYNCSIE